MCSVKILSVKCLRTTYYNGTENLRLTRCREKKVSHFCVSNLPGQMPAIGKWRKLADAAALMLQNSLKSMMLLLVGIDLGTTNSCVGVFRNGKVEIIPNEFGKRTTASCVSFTESGRLVGDAAREQAFSNPTNTVSESKRLIGRKFDGKRAEQNT